MLPHQGLRRLVKGTFRKCIISTDRGIVKAYLDHAWPALVGRRASPS